MLARVCVSSYVCGLCIANGQWTLRGGCGMSLHAVQTVQGWACGVDMF